MSQSYSNASSPITLQSVAPSRAGPALRTVGVLCAAMLFAACTPSGKLGPNDPSGLLNVRMSSNGVSSTVDETVSEVWVRVDTVQAQHEDEGWIEIADARLDINLMESDNFSSLASGQVWTGAFDRLYIGVVDSWIIVDGAEQDLAFSGNSQISDPFPDGMYINESFFIDEDSTTELLVTWDLAENLSKSTGGSWSLGSNGSATVDIIE